MIFWTPRSDNYGFRYKDITYYFIIIENMGILKNNSHKEQNKIYETMKNLISIKYIKAENTKRVKA